MDASLEKTWPLTARTSLQFRAEIYNMLNRAQLGQPLANLASPINQGPTGSGTPRQFQFALKLGF